MIARKVYVNSQGYAYGGHQYFGTGAPPVRGRPRMKDVFTLARNLGQYGPDAVDEAEHIMNGAAIEIERLRAVNAELLAALKLLDERLEIVHNDPAYKSVWAINQIHTGPYQGPTYTAELANARAAIAKAEGEKA